MHGNSAVQNKCDALSNFTPCAQAMQLHSGELTRSSCGHKVKASCSRGAGEHLAQRAGLPTQYVGHRATQSREPGKQRVTICGRSESFCTSDAAHARACRAWSQVWLSALLNVVALLEMFVRLCVAAGSDVFPHVRKPAGPGSDLTCWSKV